MKTGAAPEPTMPDLRAWAGRQLDLAPETPATQVRASYIQRLEEEDFVPPWRWQQAFAVMHGKSEADHGQALLDEEERLREEVSAFAAGYFSTPCDERCHQWRQLTRECAAHPPLAAWLRDLERGLEIASIDLEGGAQVRELTSAIADMYVLRPVARAVRRQAFLRNARANPTAWPPVVAHLEQSAPTLAALEPLLITRLKWPRRVKARPATPPVTRTPPAGSSQGNLWWLVIILLGVVSGVVRMGLDKSPSTTTPPPAFNPQPRIPRSIEDVPWATNAQEFDRRRREWFGTNIIFHTAPTIRRPQTTSSTAPTPNDPHPGPKAP